MLLLCLMHSSSSLLLMTSALSIVALFIKILFAPSFVLDLHLFCSMFVIYIDTYCSTFTVKFEF